MNVQPKQAPDIKPLPNAQPTARDRAIAKLVQSTEVPVQNATRVSPEELSVVSPPSAPQTADPTQPDTSESVSAEKPAETAPKADPLLPQYANLARKEKALRAKVQAQESAAKAREVALIAREEAIKAKEAEYQSNYISKSRLKTDPLSVLTEEGVSYEELTNAILRPPSQQDPRVMREIESLKAEVREAKEAQNRVNQQAAAQQKQAYEDALIQIRNEAKQLVATDPNFEAIKENRSVNDVVDLIKKTFQEDKVLLSVEEAAKEVEEYLVEKAIRLSKINKIQSKLQETRQKAVPQTQVPVKQQQTMKTLTNAVNASKPMSVRERAIAAFKGELK